MVEDLAAFLRTKPPDAVEAGVDEMAVVLKPRDEIEADCQVDAIDAGAERLVEASCQP